MSHKTELALMREQQLARLREATGMAEHFVMDCACAKHDRAFRATFARKSPAQRFRCESVDKSEAGQPRLAERLHGLLNPVDAPRVPAGEIEFTTLSCAWCGDDSGWTLCSRCHAMICGARSSNGSFACRKSCGARGGTQPLDSVTAGRPGSPARLVIGHDRTLLPGLRK